MELIKYLLVVILSTSLSESALIRKSEKDGINLNDNAAQEITSKSKLVHSNEEKLSKLGENFKQKKLEIDCILNKEGDGPIASEKEIAHIAEEPANGQMEAGRFASPEALDNLRVNGILCPKESYKCFNQILNKDLGHDNPGNANCWSCFYGLCVCSDPSYNDTCPDYMVDIRKCKNIKMLS